jgi:integrase
MKFRQPHVVPLVSQSVAILLDLHLVTGRRRYVFPSPQSPDHPTSENAITAALRRMGYSRQEMTWHSFRTIASTCLN